MPKALKKTAKKRLTKKQLRQSAASIKGWKTRRKRERRELLETKLLAEKRKVANAKKANAKKGSPRITPPKRKSVSKEPTVKQLQAELKKEKAARIKAEDRFKAEVDAAFNTRRERLDKEDDPFAHFVPTLINHPEWLHRDGSIAVSPSKLRWLPFPEYEALLAKVRERHENGSEEDFEDFADMIADFFDCEIQEVYTLFFSP